MAAKVASGTISSPDGSQGQQAVFRDLVFRRQLQDGAQGGRPGDQRRLAQLAYLGLHEVNGQVLQTRAIENEVAGLRRLADKERPGGAAAAPAVADDHLHRFRRQQLARFVLQCVHAAPYYSTPRPRSRR